MASKVDLHMRLLRCTLQYDKEKTNITMGPTAAGVPLAMAMTAILLRMDASHRKLEGMAPASGLERDGQLMIDKGGSSSHA